MSIENYSLEELQRLEQEIELQEGLPHLFGWKRYKWQQEFMDSINRDNFLCAANQIGKSTIAICKAIHWATDTDLWPKLWKSKPTQFWYFYPSFKLATREFKEKWEKEILPRGKYKDDPIYGWKADVRQKQIHSISFNSGVTIYFLSYKQDEADIQAGTVYAMFCDEELPEQLWPEIQARLRSTRGYYHQVFTATTGQEIWRQTIEEKGKFEKFPNAWKKQISLYDCQEYANGEKTEWTDERINEEIERCATKAEVERRIFGKFVVSEGLKYPTFDRRVHLKEGHHVPSTWNIYAGVDIGSGGINHPAAIVFVAVDPTFSKGRVIRCWRGDGVVTDCGDVFKKYLELSKDLSVVQRFYDWGAKDFDTISNRNGVPFLPANKSHDVGEGILNTLFRNNMLYIYSDDESQKLATELATVNYQQKKNNARDDLVDALRYACTGVPWDFSNLAPKKIDFRRKENKVLNMREEFIESQKKGLRPQNDNQTLEEQMCTIYNELEEWGEFYEV